MKRSTLAAVMTVLVPLSLTSDPVRAQHGPSFRHQHGPSHSHHTSLYTPSGMLMGVYARTTHDGLKIVGTIPGYSAEGRLFPGDVLLRATAADMPVLSIRSHYLMEQAKSQIGPFREAAVEFFRPRVGLMYAWVASELIDGGDVHSHLHSPQPAFGPEQVHAPAHRGNPFAKPNHLSPNNSLLRSGTPAAGRSQNAGSASPNSVNGTTNAAPQKFQAEFRLESEKPGARALFNKRGGTPSK